MFRTMLKGKIHRATITEANLDYVGSITVDENLLKAADILNHEKVQVVDVTNGSRLETYAIAGPAGSGTVCINGAAARLVHKGDKIIILSYIMVDDKEAKKLMPKTVHVDEKNCIVDVEDYQITFDAC
ncbi:aspartate 1-decarboxylase [Candidatus Oleimmundimicrobium sp.]|uniref:aspartate 1-decarboxylase n=1 Tax=Candidatus Oleimmundimicrobium sp. TaxID=3060597 RepID=UPI00271B52DC|nr:aspartate 1-decarboxylase [Candidatus Oleimmundimicrobium sp.]MDO8885660.1 aspartate 1-decarboxylase [Candidatus Oleimmundimicrobium sp.]